MKRENLSLDIQNYQDDLMRTQLFYYPRKEFAKHFVDILKKFGGSYSLFQVRRKGKTSFLINEFANEASNCFYVFYYSFMNKSKENVEDLFYDFKIKLLEFATLNIGLKTKSFNHIIDYDRINRLSNFKLNVFNNGIEAKLDEKQIRENLNGISLSDIFNFINEYRKLPVLLILDEVQELARAEDHKIINFIRELRTELDKRQNFIQTIFTGSSWNDLEKMFSNYKSPFFQYSTKVDFPDLPNEFVKHCLEVYQKETGINLDEKRFLDIFEKSGKFPLYITNLLKIMLINKSDKPDEFLKNLVYEGSFLDQKWDKLSKIEQLLLFQIIKNNEKITSKENLTYFQSCLNERLTANKVNYALKKLQENQIIRKEKQQWFFVEKQIEDFVFKKNRTYIM